MAVSGPSGNIPHGGPSLPTPREYFGCNLLRVHWQSHYLLAKNLIKVLDAVYLSKTEDGRAYTVTERFKRLFDAASSLNAPMMIGEGEITDTERDFDRPNLVNLWCAEYDGGIDPNGEIYNNILSPDRLDQVFEERPKPFFCDNKVIWYDVYFPGQNAMFYVSGMLATYHTTLQVALENMGVDFRVKFPTYENALNGHPRHVIITVTTTPELTDQQKQIIERDGGYWAQCSLAYDGPVRGMHRIDKTVQIKFKRSKSCFLNHC